MVAWGIEDTPSVGRVCGQTCEYPAAGLLGPILLALGHIPVRVRDGDPDGGLRGG